MVAKQFSLSADKALQFFINEGDSSDDSIYAILVNSGAANSFKIHKVGAYLNILAKSFFDEIGAKYKSESISYTLSDMQLQDQKMIKFEKFKRVEKKDIKKNEDSGEQE